VRILHVITKLDVGGAQSVVASLVREQMNSGHQVTIAAGVLWPNAAVQSIDGVQIVIVENLVHALQPSQDFRAVRELKSLIRSSKSDVVHTHSSKGGLLGRLAARQCNVPSIYTAHGWPFQPEAPWTQRIQSLLGEWIGGRLGNEIVCVSHAERALAERLGVGKSGHRHVIYNGIDELSTESSSRGHTRCIRSATDPFHLVTVARLETPKRVDLLVEAIAQTDDRVALTVVGDGSLLPAVQALADHLGVTHRIRFIGETNPLPYLASADAFVLLSDYEGMPVTVLEAMRAGLPILTNRLPGVLETTGADAGVLTELDSNSAATAIVKMADDPAKCLALGAAAKLRWEKHFTTAQMAAGYEEVLRALSS
jgi:glycosyltransferase involved in cell wall biosynthesis